MNKIISFIILSAILFSCNIPYDNILITNHIENNNFVILIENKGLYNIDAITIYGNIYTNQNTILFSNLINNIKPNNIKYFSIYIGDALYMKSDINYYFNWHRIRDI